MFTRLALQELYSRFIHFQTNSSSHSNPPHFTPLWPTITRVVSTGAMFAARPGHGAHVCGTASRARRSPQSEPGVAVPRASRRASAPVYSSRVQDPLDRGTHSVMDLLKPPDAYSGLWFFDIAGFFSDTIP
ncbi:hypothetical protein J6590_014650 [Homalodisca vitripennis]|nr:hypothetical protein J6590_014650 [Homalodisca vitripennis]